jgi:hypothetical protein
MEKNIKNNKKMKNNYYLKKIILQMAATASCSAKHVHFLLPEEPVSDVPAKLEDLVEPMVVVPVPAHLEKPVVPEMVPATPEMLQGCKTLTESILELCKNCFPYGQTNADNFLKKFFALHPHTSGRAISYKGSPEDMWSWGREDITRHQYVADYFVCLSEIHNTNTFVLWVQRLFFRNNPCAGGQPPVVNAIFQF